MPPKKKLKEKKPKKAPAKKPRDGVVQTVTVNIGDKPAKRSRVRKPRAAAPQRIDPMSVFRYGGAPQTTVVTNLPPQAPIQTPSIGNQLAELERLSNMMSQMYNQRSMKVEAQVESEYVAPRRLGVESVFMGEQMPSQPMEGTTPSAQTVTDLPMPTSYMGDTPAPSAPPPPAPLKLPPATGSVTDSVKPKESYSAQLQDMFGLGEDFVGSPTYSELYDSNDGRSVAAASDRSGAGPSRPVLSVQKPADSEQTVEVAGMVTAEQAYAAYQRMSKEKQKEVRDDLIKSLVESGQLKPGAKTPGTRELYKKILKAKKRSLGIRK